MPKVTAFISKEVRNQVQSLYQRGGNFQKASDKVKALLYDLTNKQTDPSKVISKLTMTNHGETRIQHCIKYDLSGYCRLVTIQDNGWLVLLYVGTHDEVDEWLVRNRGLQVAIQDVEKGLFEVFKSEDITDAEVRINAESDYSGGMLYEKLKHYYNKIAVNIPSLIKKTLEKFDTATDEEEILEAAIALPFPEQQELIFDVFMLLRAGKVDEAKNRILTYEEQLTLIQNLQEEEIQEVRSNDQFLKIDDLDAEDMRILMDHKDWLEWMLFMHPAQKAVVDRDFNGSARLLGVSGSGKTCVVVRRAVRLAKKYQGEKILVLTLNQSLSQLISDLIDRLTRDYDCLEIRDKIIVKSFWEICRDLIIQVRKHRFDQRVLGPKTDKHGETIDEVWDEYYLCKSNNNDADVMFPLHCSLLTRGIYPQDYIKQEFDWIRSFLPSQQLSHYLTVEREGRTIPLLDHDREKVIDGLLGWEKKMQDVGAIDYLGLTNEVYKYIDSIAPQFRCILVDEVQDFGTLELMIIRKLVAEGENDLFTTGDIAQQVYTKHHKIRNAGITILPDAYVKILKNYRNSREILSAAYEVFKLNTNEDQYKSEDFEILNPEFANFSSPKPFLRKASSLNDEFTSAIAYLNDVISEKEKGCITFCGYSLFNVQEIGEKAGLPILDGVTKLGKEKIYLSDLEQTKGFEFDRMIIINANDLVIPNPAIPKDEWYREISKFYVAMTRAKKELVISYSEKLSSLFNKCKDFFNEDMWDQHVIDTGPLVDLPNVDKNYLSKSLVNKMIGKEFLYHKRAIGMSKELQNKLLELVAGKPITLNGKKVGWMHMEELKSDVMAKRDIPYHSKLFGPVVYKELENVISEKVVVSKKETIV